MLVPQPNIVQLLHDTYGIETEHESTKKRTNKPTQPFTDLELATLLKQLIDLPFDFASDVVVEAAVRMATGYSEKSPITGRTIAADFNTSSRLLRIFDAAFPKERPQNSDLVDTFGAGTMLHELVHALVTPPGLREDYGLLSWIIENGRYVLRDNPAGFATRDYAATNPEEDFADHVALFLVNSAVLKTRAPKKIRFHQKTSFPKNRLFPQRYQKWNINPQSRRCGFFRANHGGAWRQRYRTANHATT